MAGAAAVPVLFVLLSSGAVCMVMCDVSVTVTYKVDFFHHVLPLPLDEHGAFDARYRAMREPIDATLPGRADSCDVQLKVEKAQPYYEVTPSSDNKTTSVRFDYGLLSICNRYTCGAGNATLVVLCPARMIAPDFRLVNERLQKAVDKEGNKMNGSYKALAEVNPWKGIFSHPFTMHAGDSVTLHCAVFAYPPPTIQWYFNNKLIGNASKGPVATTERSSDARVANSSLLVSDFASADQGEYACNASSGETLCSKVYTLRYRSRYGFVWPLIGIVVVLAVLALVIFIFERSRAKAMAAYENNAAKGSKETGRQKDVSA